MSFSAKAQCGFWVENLQPDVLTAVANSGNAAGTYALNHTLGNAVLLGESNRYLGNVGQEVLAINGGETQLYELHICPCPEYAGKKVSLDWQLERRNDLTGQWEIVNGNLSNYAEFGIYTLYSQINSYTGECQSIKWLGGIVPDNFGYCNEAETYTLLDTILGLSPCTTPTNYPGALQSQYGTLPGSVVNAPGMTTPSMGQTPIYTEAFDYFYYDFLASTRNIVTILWKQSGDYRLTMRVRERIGGTDWFNAQWGGDELAHIGGHQSCCGPVLFEDMLHYPVFDTLNMEVCMGTTVEMGGPAPTTYVFGETGQNILDTTLLLGNFVGTGDCQYIDINTIRNVNFYLRHVPVLEAQDITICRCDPFTVESLVALVHPDLNGLTDNDNYKIQWKVGPYWLDEPNLPSLALPGDYDFTIRQVNTYNDTLDCISEPVTFTVTVEPIHSPSITVGNVDFCLESIDDNTLFTAESEPDENCATTTRWYTTLTDPDDYYWMEHYPYWRQTSSILASSLLAGQGNELAVNLMDYVPSVNKDTVIYFFATSYNAVTNCESPRFDFIKVYLHQTPVLTATPMDSMYCPGSDVTMEVTITNNPFDVDPLYNFYWGDETTVVNVGDEDSGWMTWVLPLYNYYRYSYSQQIVTKEEMATSGGISSISYSVYANPDVRNIEIWLSTTDQDNMYTWDTEDNKVLVYDGNYDFHLGWNEIQFANPFNYDGTKNLLITFIDKTGSYDNWQTPLYFDITLTDVPLAARANSDYTQYEVNYSGYGTNHEFRDNMRFTVIPAFSTSDNVTAYTQTLTTKCDSNYVTSVYVEDANGCVSTPVEFHYFTGDTVNPTVTPALYTANINACEITEEDIPVYTDIEDLVAAFNLTIADNCDPDLVTLVGHEDTWTIDSCQQNIVRVYTVQDACGNTATFTQNVTSRDSIAPDFNLDRPLRIDPIPAGNCTFNAPTYEQLVAAIAPYIEDNCTEAEFLLANISFVWENTDIDPSGEEDIFRVKTHLTINAIITDKCGNTTSEGVFFLDRPDTLSINNPSMIAIPAEICFGDTVTLKFKPSHIVDDTIMGPFTPYTFTWVTNDLEDNVTILNPSEIESEVVFAAPGVYGFRMRVTDNNGCEAYSEARFVHVVTPPTLVITPVPEDVETPLCPTYGNLTIEASLVDPEDGQNLNDSYFIWEGESVNEASHIASTFIHIIPVYCDTVYHATVTTTDNYGCPATAEYTVRAQAKTPTFIGTIPAVTLEPQAPNCELVVPSFKDVITGAMIDDPCYGFYEMNGIGIKYTRKNINGEDVLVENLIANGADYDWYTQVPAMDEIVYGDTVVTITITNPCGATITTTVQLKKPNDYITVTIPEPTAAVCQDVLEEGDGVTFTAVASVAGATYEWTELDDEDVLSDEANLTIVDTLMEAGDDYMNYYYVVTATDGQGCKAQATATLTVYYQGDDIDYRVWPNTMCERNNGIIAIDTVPTGYAVILVGISDNNSNYGPVLKYSDVPAHETTNWNTIYFDSLAAGWYNATVINLHGCERTIDIEVTDSIEVDEDFDFDYTLAHCNGLGATIEVNEEEGYTYFLEKMMHGSWAMLDFYEGVEIFPSGYYRLSKMENATRCTSYTEFAIGKEESDLTFVANTTPRTSCYTSPNPAYSTQAYNGTITISTTGLKYRVTNLANNTVIYNHIDGSYAPNTDAILIEGLNIGDYYIEALDPETGCMAETTVTVQEGRVDPTFTVSTTPNNACKPAFNNGTITFDPATTYTYYVDGLVRTESWLTTRPEGEYHVYAVAANTNCRKDTTVTIDVDTYNPIVTVDEVYNNSSCDPDVMAYNGGVDFDVTGTCKYTFKLYDDYGDGWNGHQYEDGSITVTINQANFTKTITFTNGYEYSEDVQLINGIPATIVFTPDHWGEIQYDEEYFELYSPSNQLVLTRYAADGVDETEFTPNCPVAANQTFNTYIQPYNIVVKQNGVTVASANNQNTHNASITGLNEGIYNYTVTSNFGCEVTGTFTVGHDYIPEMELAQLPDHYCAPISATKPGDGQVIIVSPVAEEGETDHFYEYKFFDESWNEMEVPYNLPMTHIMYWMASGLYHVQAYDTVTGCMVEGSIEVEKAPYEFFIDVVKTPTHYCSETEGDGTVTLTVTSSNADAVYAYYHDNVNGLPQDNGYFDGLNMGDHYFTIVDVLTGCDTTIMVKITADTCRPTFTITDGEHVNGGFVYCIYDADITLTGSADSECDDHFTYQWDAPCSEINHSDNASILVDIDHVMPNGCTYIFTATDQQTGCVYDTTINVSIHERPQFHFTIDGITAQTAVSNLYCETEEILIAVVPEEGFVLETYEWTQGYDGTDSSFYFMGQDTNLNAITFCVRVTDTNNCKSTIGSLPVSFNRVQYRTEYDTACDMITFGNDVYTYLEDGTSFIVVETVPATVDHACDTIVTHEVTLYRQPEIDFEEALSDFSGIICEDAFDTIAEAMIEAVQNNLVPEGDSCSIALYVDRGNGYVEFSAPLTYADSLMKFVIAPNNDFCDTIEYEFVLRLGMIPTIDSFQLKDLYCNGEEAELRVIVSNLHPASAYIFLNTPDGEYYPEEHERIPARSDSVEFTFRFTPWNATYNLNNDSIVRLVVGNTCGRADSMLKISVDTTLPRHLDTIRVCEGDTFFFSMIEGIQGYDVQEARMQSQGEDFFTIEDGTVVLTDTTRVFFTLTNDCGNIVKTDTAVVCVKPLPKIDVDEFSHMDLCVENAAELLDAMVEVSHATEYGWALVDEEGVMYGPLTAEELVDTAKKVHDIDVYYYAANENQCGDSLRPIGNIRILMPLEITVPNITICPNNVNMANIVDIATTAGITRSHNNYNDDEVETVYQIWFDDHWYAVDATDVTELQIESGANVRVIYSPIDDDCEHAVAGFIQVTLYDTAHTDATMTEACEGSAFTDFVEVEPTWDGDAILNVDGAYWTVYDAEQDDFVKFNTETIFEYEPNSPVFVQYVWETLCGEFTTPVYELQFLINPTVQITDDALIPGTVYDTLPVCVNSLATEIAFVVEDPSDIVTDTTWTIGDATFEPGYQFTMDDNNKMLVVTVNSECESASDTVIVKVNSLPVPTATGDDIICTDGSVTLNVVDPTDQYTYTWEFNDETVAQGETALVVFTDLGDGNELINIEGHEVTVEQAEFYNFKLVATDNNTNCVSTTMINASNDAYQDDIISIKSTNAPQFIFKYQGNETHRIEGLTTGNQTEYTWEVSNECGRGDKLVFVEYTIYHNGEVINPDSLGNYFQTQTYNTNAWITRNHITWKNSQQVTQHATGYFNSSIPGFEDPITGAQSGNHFPNQDMAFGNNQQFDDVFMHFLNKNAVDKTIAPFIANGEYKIVYRLIATDYQSTYQHLYWNADSATTLRIGGHQAYSGTFDTLATDSIFLIVGGDNLAAVENPVTPEMAPAISMDENVIVPDMEVWPNPAPAIVTTFKARVYNMRGDASVTISNFAGKQVYNGNIYIDRDGYYFEADVNSLAVGAYIMTVRTKDAVISKKLVVTVRQ